MRARRMDMRNERGATIALVAVSLTALLGMGALAVDLGMMRKARGDAQRTADAAALAGAASFKTNNQPLNARDDARDWALEYAARNYVGGTTVNIDSSAGGTTLDGDRWIVQTAEAVVVINPTTERVKVIIRRSGIGTFFASIMGQHFATVSAAATAEAVDANGARCVKPFALPDMWDDLNDDTNGNNLWDGEEDWTYDSGIDNPSVKDPYRPYEGDPVKYGNITETGYGSALRNSNPDATGKMYTGDKGRMINIKPQSPNEVGVIKPGIFYPWVMPEDPTQESCGNGGGGDQGASAYSQNICTCNNSEIILGQEYPIKTGNMVGPTRFGVGDLIALDPSATWNQNGGSDGSGAVENSNATNWMDSPRIIKIALWDPVEIAKSGKQMIVFNNIALMFVESFNKGDGAVVGRFITYATGSATAGPGGPLTKVLRLVE